MQRLNKNKVAAIVIVLLALLAYMIRFWIFQIPLKSNLLLSGFSLTMMSVAWIAFNYMHRLLDQRFDYDTFLYRRIFLQIAVTYVFITLLSQLGFRTLVKITGIPEVIEHQFTQLAQVAGYTAQLFLVILLNVIHLTEYALRKWRENATRAANLEKEKSQVQFDNLKNQLNPHFLFNSLTSLDSLIQEKPELARQFLQQLSKVFRYLLQHQERGLVPLETELDFVKNYLFLLKTRFEGSLQIDLVIDNEALDKQITPVTLQILIENAIKHNIVSVRHPLKITIKTEADVLLASNPIQLKKQVESSNNQGLNNLKALYSFLSEKPIEISNTGDTFTVKVPLLSGE